MSVCCAHVYACVNGSEKTRRDSVLERDAKQAWAVEHAKIYDPSNRQERYKTHMARHNKHMVSI